MKKIMILTLFMWSQVGHPSSIFSTLSQLQKYAANMEEYPPNDTVAWSTPKYTLFWRKQIPSRWHMWLSKWRLRPKLLWDIASFKELMSTVTEANESNGYIDRFVIKMKPAAGSIFVIWGDIQGAFHSLTRGLTFLREKGYINEQLQIIKPYTYFVFNGALVNRGAYSLDVLTLIMRLMEINPQKIFYIKGNEEDAGHWKNFNLKDELIQRASSVSKQEIPLGKELDRFFNTLPMALYLIDQDTEKSVDVVRISYFDRKFTELNEDNFSIFFHGPFTADPTIFKLGVKSEDNKKKVNIRAIIEGESRSAIYRPTPGLAQLEADKGATAWTILSSPIESYRHLQDFYFDAFVMLDIGKQLNDWTLTLYNQDVRELLGFQQYGIFNLATGLREYQKEKSGKGSDPFAELHKKLRSVNSAIEQLATSCPVAKEAMQSNQDQGESNK